MHMKNVRKPFFGFIWASVLFKQYLKHVWMRQKNYSVVQTIAYVLKFYMCQIKHLNSFQVILPSTLVYLKYVLFFKSKLQIPYFSSCFVMYWVHICSKRKCAHFISSSEVFFSFHWAICNKLWAHENVLFIRKN